MATRDRQRPEAQEQGEEALQDVSTGADTPEAQTGAETPVPEAPAVSESTAPVHVPLEDGRGGCYVIGDDGMRVRVPD